ncbi:MAG TPA: thioredoxin family protein [Thermoanaerobaculia bacterium]|nr:thioredoxin family protein [Thermoanaerobaculia bacterium]
MKRALTIAALLALLIAGGALYARFAPGRGEYPSPNGGPAIGKPAPEFTAVDTYGKTHSLSQYRGKWVVLEWVNYDCPYVGKHYNSHTMQALQKKYTDKGVVWLSIVSSAPGNQGNYPNDEMNALTKEKGASPSALLVDASGAVGHLYDARTTPHMFVINPQGTLLYMGGIDDKPGTRVVDLKTARPHVDMALQEAMSGKPVSVPTSQPYGCSVKY